MIDWIKNNLRTVLLVGLILVCFFFLRKWGTGYFEGKRQIEALNDSIELRESEYRLMEERVSALQEIVSTAVNAAQLYRDSMYMTRNDINNNNIRHEREVANLTRIPVDTLYLDLKEYLRSVSFQ